MFFHTKYLWRLLAVVSVAWLLAACDEHLEDPSEIAMFITPSADSVVVVHSGDKVVYTLDLYTDDSRVVALRAESFDLQYGQQTLLNLSDEAGMSRYVFVYDAPEINRDTLEVSLVFTAYDAQGHEQEVKRHLKVVAEGVLIGEKSGIILFREETGLPNALAMASPTQPFNLAAAADSSQADIYMKVDEAFQTVDLFSATGLQFVRTTTFDYAAATAYTIQQVFSGSLRENRVGNLRVNDIVLVGRQGIAYGAFRVLQILRTGEADERCVQLAVKEVSHP